MNTERRGRGAFCEGQSLKIDSFQVGPSEPASSVLEQEKLGKSFFEMDQCNCGQ